MNNAGNNEKNSTGTNERRREIRLRRSNLLENPMERAITYKIASDRDEMEQCFKLAYQSYVDAGYQSTDHSGIRFTKYHLLPSSKIFLALFRPSLTKDNPSYEELSNPGEVVGTLSLIPNTPLGLPMEEICNSQVQALRDEGGFPAEVVALAVNPEYRKYNIMMYLYKLMFEYAQLKGISDITCSVTKRHCRFYQNILLFEPMGELETYPSFEHVQAQCHRLNIKQARIAAKEAYHSRHFDADLFTFFFSENPEYSRPRGEGGAWLEEDISYFLSQHTELRDSLDDRTLTILRQEYNRLNYQFPY